MQKQNDETTKTKVKVVFSCSEIKKGGFDFGFEQKKTSNERKRNCNVCNGHFTDAV